MKWYVMGLEYRSLSSPRGCHPCPVPRGSQSGHGEGAEAPFSFSPIICLRARDLERRHPKRSWVEGPLLAFQGASRESQGPTALVPAGASWGEKGRRLGTELPPPLPRLEQTRRRRAPGNSWESSAGTGKPRKRRESATPPPPLSVPACATPDNGSSTFPLSLPAPRSSRSSPPATTARTPAPAPSQKAAGCPQPLSPQSRITQSPPPTQPPFSLSAGPARSGCGAPSQAREQGRRWRKGSQQRVSGSGSTIGSSVAQGCEGGIMGEGGPTAVGSWAGSAGSGRHREKGRKKDSLGSRVREPGRAGPGCRLSLSPAARARRPAPAAGPARDPLPRPPAAAGPGSCVSPPPGS